MSGALKGKKVAILVADGFEQVELTDPRKALEGAGAATEIVSPTPAGAAAPKGGEERTVRGWKEKEWGDRFPIDRPLEDAREDDYDALLLPGGVMNPDRLRRDPRAVAFVRAFFDARKPVAAICHAPWTLIEADVARGRRLTSFESLRTDLTNAGAEWVDRPVVVDNGLVTSRKPDDLPAFDEKMIEEFAEGRHAQRRAG